MGWLKWFPWRFLIRWLAKRHEFIDPVTLLARLRNFSQPSEVGEPIELLRAGIVFHARGLINSRVIQNNLDWVWPYWIRRQFDPHDDSFIPRAFSITHVNLTHRNWTAVGWPDCEQYPIVDPRGLLTPLYDGWSLDSWILKADKTCLIPSAAPHCQQTLELGADGIAVQTHSENGLCHLTTRTWVELDAGQPVCHLQIEATADEQAWAVVAIRPMNPEGVSFIHTLCLNQDRQGWTVNEETPVIFSESPSFHRVSDYHNGDVYLALKENLQEQANTDRVSCKVGMATAAALFKLPPGKAKQLEVTIPLPKEHAALDPDSWRKTGQNRCHLQIPDPRDQFLFDAAIATLVLHSPKDVYPGPYTYKRFWFRDAAFIIHGLLCAGLIDRAERALEQFPQRQSLGGYFHSQEGEWDANGEVLWILQRFCQLTNQPLKESWRQAVCRGAQWIIDKRLPDDGSSPHAGLMPPGFSAEHLGPNDYYYWDDFWSIAGLRAASYLLETSDPGLSQHFAREAEAFQAAVNRSLDQAARRLGRTAMPAAPYRRLDAGAVGSLAAGYPLQLYDAHDPKLMDTAKFLLEKCFVEGGFFQDMIHSGINAYLTLHVAQVLLRAGDSRCMDLMDAVANLASPTGQWPEAIHPRTQGGCMGDGQHVWAAAEWVLMIRNCFVREEGKQLILCQGIPERWLQAGKAISFGPAPTTFGILTVTLQPCDDGEVQVSWRGQWHHQAPPIQIQLPGYKTVIPSSRQTAIKLCRQEQP